MATNSLRFERLGDELQKGQVEHVLLSSLASLRYFIGYSAPIETGPSPFTPLMGALLCKGGEQPELFLADMESPEGVREPVSIRTFASYTIERPLAAVHDLTVKLLESLRELPRSRVGIESEDLPAAVLEQLRAACPQLEFRDITSLLARMRMVKDAEEITAIREAVALCDLGQDLARKLARVGMTEIELFAEVRKGIEVRAGGRVPILADLISGSRTAQIGGSPTSRQIELGDLIICDLAPRHNGYWGDSCNTLVAGEPSAEDKKFFAGVSTALQEGTARVRPGMRACDLDSAIRNLVLRLNGGYPHHTGHGLGVTWHEEPRIVPYNTLPLQPGMVVALEPGIYFKERWGMRLEHVIHVTEAGAEVLSKFKQML